MKVPLIAVLLCCQIGCIGDPYRPIISPTKYYNPSVFERLPGKINSFRQGGNTVSIYNECIDLSDKGNGDASYAAAIVVGQGFISKFQDEKKRELEMMRLMIRAKDQGSIEAKQFIEAYNDSGVLE